VALTLDLTTSFLLSLEILVREVGFADTSQLLLVEVLLSNFSFFLIFLDGLCDFGERRELVLASSVEESFFDAFFAIAFALSSL